MTTNFLEVPISPSLRRYFVSLYKIKYNTNCIFIVFLMFLVDVICDFKGIRVQAFCPFRFGIFDIFAFVICRHLEYILHLLTVNISYWNLAIFFRYFRLCVATFNAIDSTYILGKVLQLLESDKLSDTELKELNESLAARNNLNYSGFIFYN